MLFFVSDQKRVWSEEKIYLECEDMFSDLICSIEKAEKTIDAEIYIFQFDETGEKVLAAVKAAAARGVEVRLLVDTVGSILASSRLEKEIKHISGIELRWYHRFWRPYFFPSFRRFNRRNHRKVWILDSEQVYVSSANVAHMGWKDVSMRVEGEEVGAILNSFEIAWQKPSLHPSKSRRSLYKKLIRSQNEGHDDDLVHLNDTSRRRRTLRSETRKRLQRATQRIWLANPYFAPPPSFVRSLCRMARKGVDVRVLAPSQSDVFFMRFVTYGYCLTLLKAGVKLFAYTPRVYHAKIRIVDDHYLVGTSNLDFRSVLYNLEMDLKVTHPHNQKLLEADLLHDYENNCIAVTQEMITRVSWMTKLLARLFSLFRYWV